MQTIPPDFFPQLARLPLSLVRLEAQRQLEALRPGRAVLHSTSDLFDVPRFAKEGQCALTSRPECGALHELWPDDDQRETRLIKTVLFRWDDVEWQGQHFEVIELTLRESGCDSDLIFLVAADQSIGERFFLAVSDWCSSVRGAVLVFEQGHFGRNEALHAEIQRASFDDLILPPQLRDAVRDDVRRFTQAKDTYARYRVPWKRGLLLLGPPGNGKTHTLRALIHETRWPCLYVKSFHTRDGIERGITRVFERARRMTPCVLVLEDLDCLVADEHRSVLLNELDGFSANEGLLVVASTNHPEKLDRSLLDRPSRFDRKFHFGLPAPEERRRYLEHWQAGVDEALKLTAPALEVLVDGTHGFTFAYLKELTFGAMLAFMETPVPGSMDDVAARVLGLLKQEMSSARKMLPPLPDADRRISLS